MNHIFSVHSSVVGHLSCFQLLAITNKGAMNIVEQVPLWHGRESFGYMPKSGIAGSLGKSVSSFLRNLQIDFRVIVPVYNPISNGGVLLSLHILANIYLNF